MRIHTVLSTILICIAMLLSSCRTPPPSAYDRPPNVMKFHSGGFNPGTNNARHPH
jgi:hypothetical protein